MFSTIINFISSSHRVCQSLLALEIDVTLWHQDHMVNFVQLSPRRLITNIADRVPAIPSHFSSVVQEPVLIEMTPLPSWKPPTEQYDSATKIQSMWRGHRSRLLDDKLRTHELQAKEYQSEPHDGEFGIVVGRFGS